MTPLNFAPLLKKNTLLPPKDAETNSFWSLSSKDSLPEEPPNTLKETDWIIILSSI